MAIKLYAGEWLFTTSYSVTKLYFLLMTFVPTWPRKILERPKQLALLCMYFLLEMFQGLALIYV